VVAAHLKRYDEGSWQKLHTRRVYVFRLDQTITLFKDATKKREIKGISVRINLAGIHEILTAEDDIWQVSTFIISSILNRGDLQFESDAWSYVLVEVDGERTK